MGLFEELGDMLRKQQELYTKQHELVAIHFSTPFRTPEGVKRSVASGDIVRVENGVIVSSDEKPATHKVLMCLGTVLSTNLEIFLIELETHRPLTIKLGDHV